MDAPQPLVGRYRFLRTFQGAPSGAIWLASDTVQERTVVAATVSGPRSRGLKRIVGLRHPHLATVLEFVDRANPAEVPSKSPLRPGTGVAVAEYIAGQTLHERLETGGITPPRAVRMMIHVASALAAIHERGGVHGALSPRAIVVARTGGGAVPVLTNLRAIANGAYCSPERVRAGGPGAQDDGWALHATLYTAVTGAAPFGGRTREQVAHSILAETIHTLADYGIDDPALQGILSRGLDRQPGGRPRTVVDIGRELTAWLATQTDVEPDGASALPPPDFAPRSIPPPQIDDEAVTSAAVHTPRLMAPAVILRDSTPGTLRDSSPGTLRDSSPGTLRDSPVAMQQIRAKSSAGDQAVLAALTTKLHAPQMASLMDAMTRPSSPDLADAEDDETAVMSVPELEGLRQQVFRADRLVQPPSPQAPPAAEEPDLQTTKDAGVPAGFFETPPAVAAPQVEAPVPPAEVEPPADYPVDRRAAPSSSGDWPARSLFDSMTEERDLPLPRGPVEIVPPAVDMPVAFPQVTPSAPELVAASQAPQPAEPAPPQPAPVPAPRRRTGLWLGLLLLFLASFAAAAFLAITYQDRLPFRLPRLPSGILPTKAPEPALSSPPAPAASSATSAEAPPIASTSASAVPVPAASAEPSDSAAPAASSAAAPTADAPACVKSFFPTDTFVRDVPLDYVCGEDDPRTVAISLHRMLVKAGAGAVTGGMKTWSGLGWYELPVVVILRRSCCEASNPLTWPAAEGSCPVLGPLVDGVVTSRGDEDKLKAAEQAYEDGIRCYFTGGLPRPFRYNGLPISANRKAFEGFLRDDTR